MEKMSCKEARAKVTLLHQGKLDDETTKRVTEHFQKCPRCSKDKASY